MLNKSGVRPEMQGPWLVGGVLILYILAGSAFGSIVKLNHTYHLIELTTTRSNALSAATNYDGFVQPFNDLVIGQDACLKSSPPSETYNFDLSAQPIIYSDANMTLSFLLEISFQALDLSVFPSVKGYQISIDMNDGRGHATTTCIQIIPRAGQIPSEFYKLRIKDPSFMSIFNQSYAFYFGQVQVQAISCDPVNVLDSSKHAAKSFGALNSSVWSHCVATGPKSVLISAGIKKSNPNIDTITPYKVSKCATDMINSTCIQRLLGHDHYYLMIHPMPDHFDQVVARFFTTTMDGGYKSTFSSFKPKIESNREHKLENNLVFKLVRCCEGRQLFPLIIFDQPNDQNECKRRGEQKDFCYQSSDTSETSCHLEPNTTACTECVYPDSNGLFSKIKTGMFPTQNNLHDLVFSKQFHSQYCDKITPDLLKAYNFDGVKLETKFQDEDLNLTRSSGLEEISQFDLEHSVLGISIGFCVSKGSKLNTFKIEFNDAKKTAITSLLADRVYQVHLYLVQASQLSVDEFRMIKIEKKGANLILNRTTLFSEIDNIRLVEGEYLIELFESNVSDRCLMQTNTKSQLRAVDCPRFYGSFGLRRMALTNISTLDQAHHLESKNMKACSSPSLAMANSIDYSFNLQTGLQPETLERLRKALREEKSSSVFESSVSRHHHLRALYVRYRQIYIYFDLEEDSRHFPTTVIIIASVITVGVILILIQILYTFAKSAFDFRSQRRSVLIYLPVHVNLETQKLFQDLMVSIRGCIEKYFKNISIEFVDLQTSPEQKHELLKSCDLILFVIADSDHLQPVNLDQLPPIGQSAYQFDFDLIHRVEQYQAKCVDITFNQSLTPDGRLFKFPEHTKRLVSIIFDVKRYKGNAFKKLSMFLVLKKVRQSLAKASEDGLDEYNQLDLTAEELIKRLQTNFFD